MSIAVVNEVLDSSRTKGSARLLMVVLAEQAHEDGLTWPGIARLARRVGTTERNIQYLLRELEESGELIVERSAGRGNTNEYRVLPPLTSARLIVDLTAHLEKVKNSAEKVKISALLEKVKFSAEKVKDSVKKVKSSAEKVKPTSPEPLRTNYNQLQPTAAGEIEIVEPAPVNPAAADPELENDLDQTQQATASWTERHLPGLSADGADRAEVADATGNPPAPHQEKLPDPQPAMTSQATSLEEVPGGAARSVLAQVLAPLKLELLLEEYLTRGAWLTLDPAHIRELAAAARNARGRKFRGELIAALDDAARPAQRPQALPDDDDEPDMDALMRAAPLYPATSRRTP